MSTAACGWRSRTRVAAWGTYRNLPEGQDFTTAELKANVFAPGHPGDVLHAVGRPLHSGAALRSGRCGSRRNDDPRNAAFFTCTQMLSATEAA